MKNQRKALRRGGYSIIISAIVFAVVIILNLAVSAIPTVYTQFSTSDYYTVTDASKNILSKLKDDVVIYSVVSYENRDEMIEKYLKKYAEYSSHISVENIDPATRPNFLSEYTEYDVDSSMTTVIVKNKTDGRFKVIYYNDIFYDSYGFDYESFTYYYTYCTYYGSYFDEHFEAAFSLENKLTSAVDYVTTENRSVIYQITGNGERKIDDTVSGLIGEENIELKELSLKTVSEIPSDCSAVVIYSPELDFEENEISQLKEYLSAGGNIIALTDRTSGKLPMFDAFLSEYGLIRDAEKIVCEGDSLHRGTTGNSVLYNYVFPIVTENDYSKRISGNGRILVHDSNYIGISEELPDNVTVSTLLTTTSSGYVKSVTDKTLEKTSDEEEGQYNIAVQADITGDSEKTGKLLLFGSSYIINGGTVGVYSNVSYMMSVFTQLCGKENSVTIDSQSLNIEPLTVPEASSNIWGIIVIVIIPATVLAYGIVVWRRRCSR